jgi:hypothetical protein
MRGVVLRRMVVGKGVPQLGKQEGESRDPDE